ncbi:thioredoxin fold domain-containing protein [Kangiella geojedonensis]|uniref:Thiol:disulfide interchange protein n=1 Tax=Kangiella geojedonensis TaxID=914150 RepID=A0A0F6TRR1_9GAMM|nr:thioredoxin fold domain-containing protein [Kangiella geojedonensis]AKE52434.1 Disulfide bond isomerase, periplasmic chaperone activated by DsbD homodimeric [Kangiella geojedonensis]
MQNLSKLLFIGLLGSLLLAAGSQAATKEATKAMPNVKSLKQVDTLNKAQIKQLLQAKFPSASIQHIAPSEIDGLYSFVLQGDLYYIANNGKYLLKGQMLDISTPKVRNLSSERMAEIQKKESPMRMAEINKLDESSMVVYKAPNEQHVITIFTDVDCGFCQKLHRERQDYLDLGITLRYLAFPRAGLDSKSADKLRGIWCASDQQTAMTDAKIRNKYRNGNCKTPFKEHMALVRKFGLNGTPGIILENGDLIGGYLPAQVLNRRLNELGNPSTVANK